MYYSIYKPETVFSKKKCTCGHCDVFPELFHALPVDITPYRIIRDLKEAQNIAKRNGDAVVIEWPNDLGQPQRSYKNINTGKTWKYDGYKWNEQK